MSETPTAIDEAYAVLVASLDAGRYVEARLNAELLMDQRDATLAAGFALLALDADITDALAPYADVLTQGACSSLTSILGDLMPPCARDGGGGGDAGGTGAGLVFIGPTSTGGGTSSGSETSTGGGNVGVVAKRTAVVEVAATTSPAREHTRAGSTSPRGEAGTANRRATEASLHRSASRGRSPDRYDAGQVNGDPSKT